MSFPGGRQRTPVSLALQGGGALGAFTWGLLDRILEDGRLIPRAFTGASAGAMNAAVAADGLIAGGADGARARLQSFWHAVGAAGGGFAAAPAAWASFWRGLGGVPAAGLAAFDAMLRAAQPFDRPPLSWRPLREIVESHVDFDRLRTARGPALFVGAADVRTGEPRVFARSELSPETLLASACLPALFPAVEIDGAAYWDGGYAANPPLLPLLARGLPRDVVIAPLNPMRREITPRTADEVAARVSEISFNAPLLAELRALGLAKRLARGGLPASGFRGRLRGLRLHLLASDGALNGLASHEKLQTETGFLERLRDLGRAAAEDWLAGSARDVGRRSGLDIEAAAVARAPWAE
jgi:NTE family protein